MYHLANCVSDRVPYRWKLAMICRIMGSCLPEEFTAIMGMIHIAIGYNSTTTTTTPRGNQQLDCGEFDPSQLRYQKKQQRGMHNSKLSAIMGTMIYNNTRSHSEKRQHHNITATSPIELTAASLITLSPGDRMFVTVAESSPCLAQYIPLSSARL